ncbi:MAG: amidohydrolase family protein [Chloroflexi bacterium]|nr:amidohydrolase family protein [Chloroflexota bacterium]
MVKKETRTLIHNIGTLVSGDISHPILEADAVLIEEGLIVDTGSYEALKDDNINLDIDIQGMTLCPGLIDAHVHAGISDWSPRVKTMGWMEGCLHGGVTTLISQGEHIFPGMSHEPSVAKAIAMLAHKAYSRYRPGGVKAHCGALMLEEGLTETDIKEVADAGVWLLAEIGLGALRDFDRTYSLVQAARNHGMKVPVHWGPESIPGVVPLTASNVVKLNPDVVVHFNGGPTAASLAEMKVLAEGCPCFLEVIYASNARALRDAIRLVAERGELRRILFGTDTPTGKGVMPTGIIKLAAEITSLYGISAAITLAMATGNAAIAYSLNTGMVKPGREADLLVMDAPAGSQGQTALEAMEFGDQPNLGMVMVDGKVITRTAKRAINTAKKVLVNGEAEAFSLDEMLF